jgi:Zn-finger nucleic acid-binding protein
MNERTTPPMSCPLDGATLVMSERQGIEIDYCPTCRGVWLDRGELDKIIERNATETAPRPEPGPDRYAPQPIDRRHDHDDYRGYGHRKRKKSFLSELFD